MLQKPQWTGASTFSKGQRKHEVPVEIMSRFHSATSGTNRKWKKLFQKPAYTPSHRSRPQPSSTPRLRLSAHRVLPVNRHRHVGVGSACKSSSPKHSSSASRSSPSLIRHWIRRGERQHPDLLLVVDVQLVLDLGECVPRHVVITPTFIVSSVAQKLRAWTCDEGP